MSYQPYPGGGYQPYSGGPDGGLPERQQPPPSVLNAVKLMYVGAALSGIAAVIGLTAVGSVRTTLRNQTNPALSTSQINLAVNVFIVGVVVVGLIGIGLWLWMAVKSKAGRNWARITGTVFFAVNTLLLLASITRPGAAASRIVNILGWLVGLGVVFMLWRRQSSDYFQGQAAPW
jgi:hypothetical protein